MEGKSYIGTNVSFDCCILAVLPSGRGTEAAHEPCVSMPGWVRADMSGEDGTAWA